LLLIFAGIFIAGCAPQIAAVKDNNVVQVPEETKLLGVDVSQDAAEISINADHPLVYTSYFLDNPSRLIVDLSQTSFNPASFPIVINKGALESISVTKHIFDSGSLARIELKVKPLTGISVASDPNDMKKLVIKLSQPPTPPPIPLVVPQQKQEQQEAKTVDSAVPIQVIPVTPPKPAETATDGDLVINKLKSVEKSDGGILLKFENNVGDYKTFRLNNPERLVIDIPKAKTAMSIDLLNINAFNIANVRIGRTEDTLRVVFDAQKGLIPPYNIKQTGTGILITFAGGTGKELPAGNLVSIPAGSGSGSLDKITFHQFDELSRIEIRTSGSCQVKEPVKANNGFMLVIKDCSLPVSLQHHIDTSSFGGVVQDIVPYTVKVNGRQEVRISAKLRTDVQNSLRRNGDLSSWEFQEPSPPVRIPLKQVQAQDSQNSQNNSTAGTDNIPLPSVPQKTASDQAVPTSDKVYTGQKISLEFADADIRRIFQLLSDVSKQNFILSDDVKGTITLQLKNVPWDQALAVILENEGLGMQKEGNIIQIKPKSKIKSLDDEAVELRIAQEKRMPLETAIFDVNFADITAVEKQFKALKSLRTDASITVDARTNKIIVVDIAPNVQRMRALLTAIDTPEKQVMIEARIVEASSDFTRTLGVNWDVTYTGSGPNNGQGISLGGIVANAAETYGSGGLSTAGLTFGKLIKNINIDMRLSASSTLNQVKIISSPKVMTLNNKPAKIAQGQMIPYQNSTSAEGATTQFIEAALTLEVTPHITPDGNVDMKIKATNNSAGTAPAGSTPPINTKEATTELVVKDGETTVIGGIYVDSDTAIDTGVPFLSEIPLLGWLFKSRQKEIQKNELLIFITPKIVN